MFYILFILRSVFPTDKMSYRVSLLAVRERENGGGVNLVC